MEINQINLNKPINRCCGLLNGQSRYFFWKGRNRQNRRNRANRLVRDLPACAPACAYWQKGIRRQAHADREFGIWIL